jgi:uncharacterized DUF497 family protein
VRSYRFEWDDEKAAHNLAKHGVRFEKAIDIFDDPFIATFRDYSHSIDEDRQISIGSTFWDEVLVVSHTTCGERIRIISPRHATKAERRKFMNDKHDYINDKDDLQPEYDFDYSKGERGKYYQGRGRLVIRVSLDEDVAKHYSTTESVNAALRQLIAQGKAPAPRNE